jgi:hypothetical protein
LSEPDAPWASAITGTALRGVPFPLEETIMKRALLLAAVLTSVGAGAVQADDKKPAKAPLPHEGQVAWDVQLFEASATFEVVKREVKGNQVIWVLENKRDLGTEITFGFHAAFCDEDGVRLLTVEVEAEPFLLNLPKGERNRFVLTMPKQDQWKNIRKVVLTGLTK